MLRAILVSVVLGALAGLPRVVAAEPIVRVLLLQSAGPVEVELAGERHRVRPDGSGVSDGRRRAGVLRFEAGGRVGVRGRQYRGGLAIHRDRAGMSVVNEVPLEDYVAGTLLAEVYGSWEDSVLRAQAVATRTYVLYRARRVADKPERPYDVEATQLGQVYRGISAETPRAWEAVRATEGQYLAWRDAPILAAFHSASGGRTASSAEVWGRALPYLVSLDVEGEEGSPDTYWRTYLSRREVQRVLGAEGIDVGEVRDLQVASHSPSGRVATVRIVGSRRTETVSPRRLRRAFGGRVVRSTLFEVRRDGKGFWVVGSGRGHGVGMSQWGARALAQRGVPYRDILLRFYPGTELVEMPRPVAAPPPQVSAGPPRILETGELQ